jgi:hypothetical protein
LRHLLNVERRTTIASIACVIVTAGASKLLARIEKTSGSPSAVVT